MAYAKVGRNGKKEFDKEHLENAIFFDLDNNSATKRNSSHDAYKKKVGRNCI